MNITRRLFLAFSLLSVALIVLLTASIFIINGFQDRFRNVQEDTIPSITQLGQMEAISNELTIWMYRHQSQTDISKLQPVEMSIQKKIEELKTLTQNYLKNQISNEEDREITLHAIDNIRQLDEKLPAFLEASRAHNDALSLGLLQQSDGVGAVIRNLINDFHKQVQLNVEIGKTLRATNRQIYSSTVLWMPLVAGFSIFLLGLLAITTTLNIRRKLNNMMEVMKKASDNLDLTIKADDSRLDEVGLTAKAFNELITRVHDTLLSVSNASHSVSSAASQIAAGNEDLSSRTEEQAASLEQTASSMAQLSETVRMTADNTHTANLLTENVRKLSESSSARVHTMLETMTSMRSSSSKITDIIGLIEGIAFQTNILALNAAVEAARAGEQGRGFAVVAGEVRNLAQRSSTSAREIKELIEESLSLIEAGALQAEEVGENMAQMNGAIQQVTALSGEVATATTEQTLGINQVHQAVSQMDDVTQQNAALVEQASAASQSLMEQATSLRELVNGFILTSAFNLEQNTVVKPKSAIYKKNKRDDAPSTVTTDAEWESF
ncbi:HAMP domain-containing protein (plasmid) [Kosakonia radicincitans]|uniref:methyl-accepting chemotaxis protein n=1 Tax=Kosakonia radicincitans TaxID=283686 RepID=UPI0011EC4493|nr:methyl-accepting chemotaxis protein [Kosakonia radicincitans]QEM94343.1 HAMP domain-containing protein [Kosakonia radicincitans]